MEPLHAPYEDLRQVNRRAWSGRDSYMKTNGILNLYICAHKNLDIFSVGRFGSASLLTPSCVLIFLLIIKYEFLHISKQCASWNEQKFFSPKKIILLRMEIYSNPVNIFLFILY